MRENSGDGTVRVWEAGAEDYDDEAEETIFPPFMRNIAGFDYGDARWDSLVHVLNGINANQNEARYGLVDNPISESIFVVRVLDEKVWFLEDTNVSND